MTCDDGERDVEPLKRFSLDALVANWFWIEMIKP